ncbi:MAG: PKD domain-containing protein [Candidatus Marinimicrobia bacterium]|jgi:poly-gamma-glutamate capsule biosynthesis protein CapA/YwtB (metallophosphatase superfamily)|nr:PKD domain-containing protein [Candidatus Neomarinimicrobiota bacterium]MBT3631030.1 PKD domain-containing protein [Candidatus Neomarinimicrobiota bacterium]MBT3825670.1 PKD domain-containing protein [Candidatus Neomarinimicrobiota bacterium]MBT4296193.1 PKD domain-containing protein [Candidatus Neomarinimicrobiota bacterium]MBT4992310.1 PKD domain-containing protein [Candidatus Neomarinimicrobiota bacterium]
MEFIGGVSSSTAYDNYVSHVSEGIADEGYNDYGPDWVDVQSDGFGNYRIIPEFAYTLTHWRNIFEALLQNNVTLADQLLSDSLDTFHYELVQFEDVVFDRTFYLIREQLDMSYMDMNQPDFPGDEVAGSFANGWGLFIINPDASRSHVIVEIPHPCDDFISPYLGAEMFLQTDAFAMMISGAGREVKWTESYPYSNNKSLSDPSRNNNTVFQVFHEVLCDSLVQLGPHSPLVLHTHSFDDNSAHADFQSIVLSSGYDAANANKPIRDISDDNLDLVNFTAEFPIDATQFGEHAAERVDEYYRVHYSGEFLYHGAERDIEVPHTYTLLGPNTGVQMLYLRQFFNNNEVYEPWVQIEFFEKPMLFQNLDMPLSELYAGEYPSSYQNYSILMEYYQPFIDGLEAYLSNWMRVADETPPPAIPSWRTEFDGQSYVSLRWDPVYDTNHKTYRIIYDTDSLTATSDFVDASTSIQFADPNMNHFMMENLEPDEDYVFRIEAEDHFGNFSPTSETINDNIPGHEPITVLENFDSGQINLQSYSDEDYHPLSWVLDSDRTFMNSNYSLEIWGNTWKSQSIDPHPVSEGSVFQVAAYIQNIGEIQGIAFQDSLNTLFYAFDGSQQLDIEEWVTVYQGYFPEDTWNLFRLPVGDDWYARFDYYPRLTNIVYINDRDTDPYSRIFFDEIFDISNAIAFAPEVEIQHSQSPLYRNSSYQRSVDINFQAQINDPDSETHAYLWNFGDGETSQSTAPSHTYLVEDDHDYTVILQVTDESGNMGQARAEITVDQGDDSFPLKLNFVGDVMIARRYEDTGGILETQGINAIFEPTLEFFGDAADLSIANLECVMTIDGEEHPTKSVAFKGHPQYVSALSEAGIDIVSLANNHTLDYGLTGLQTTQQTLAQNNILYSGSGEDSDEAYEPLFTNNLGVSIAWLANCDRTGQYNNFQPYLNAGYNKPGFAYLTPYYLLQQINAVRDVADLVVMEMHAGSEYSSSPGAGYDGYFGSGIAAEDWIAPRELNINMDLEEDSAEDENYSFRQDVPHMWDREIRHFAIDGGADLVVVHHPHIIQGFEVYNGKLIAHSLGNFVFDLNYHETFPSVILNAEVDASGFAAYSATPVYLDDYIPVPATGALGVHLLDYLAKKSRDLETYLYVDRENASAAVWLDTLSMPRTTIYSRRAFDTHPVGTAWMSDPLEVHQLGNLSSLASPPGIGWEYRLGRELLWYGNMENEGASEWNTNTSDEWFDLTEAHSGERSIGQHRTPSSGDNVITNLENRVRLDATRKHHISAYLKTRNASNVKIQVRYYSGRTTSTILATHDMNSGVDGTTGWTYFHQETVPPANASYFDIRLNTDMPSVGDGYGWFDDVHFIEWTDWRSAPEDDIKSPNDYYFIQLKNGIIAQDLSLEFIETIYTDPQAISPAFEVDGSIALIDAEVHFTDLSSGQIGWWEWDFGDGSNSAEQHPTHIYTEPGFYDVSLSIKDHTGALLTETQIDLMRIFSEYLPGDLNFDGQNSVSDIVILVNIIIGELSPSEAQNETANVNGDAYINVQDLVSLINLILYN